MPTQNNLLDITQQGMSQLVYPNTPYQSVGQYYPCIPPMYANQWTPLGWMPFAAPQPIVYPSVPFGYTWQPNVGSQVQLKPGNMVTTKSK